MDIGTGYLIAFIAFCLGWAMCLFCLNCKGHADEQAKDDAAQINFLKNYQQ